MDDAIRLGLVVVLSYALGALPSAYVIARLRGVNIFEVGSGNMGATNVVRAVGTRMGVLVLLLDALKGMVAIALARQVILPTMPDLAAVLAATIVIVGHNWSLWVRLLTGRLRGGKGAATALGTMLMIAPWTIILSTGVVGTVIIMRTRYMSLGVLMMLAVAAPSLLLAALLPGGGLPPVYAVYVLVVTGMTLYRFRENIRNLLRGTERRLGERT